MERIQRKCIPVSALVLISFLVCLQAFAAQNAQNAFKKGTACLKQGDPAEAIDFFTEAIELEPEHSEAYNNRGLAYYRQDQYAEAEKDFLKAVMLDPGSEKIHNNLGIVYCRLGRHEKALIYLARALRLSNGTKPCHIDIYNNIGFIYTKKGMGRKARKAYKTAERIAEALHKKNSLRSFGNAYCQKQKCRQPLDGHIVAVKFYSPKEE